MFGYEVRIVIVGVSRFSRLDLSRLDQVAPQLRRPWLNLTARLYLLGLWFPFLDSRSRRVVYALCRTRMVAKKAGISAGQMACGQIDLRRR